MSELFPQTPREYAVDRVSRGLAEELPSSDLDGLRSHADALCAIAESLEIPFEALIRWTHYRAPNKEWSQAEFRRWATSYAADMKALTVPAVELEGEGEPARPPWIPAPCAYCSEVLLTEAQAASHICVAFCTRCYGHEMQRVGEHWFCSNCGSSTSS